MNHANDGPETQQAGREVVGWLVKDKIAQTRKEIKALRPYQDYLEANKEIEGLHRQLGMCFSELKALTKNG